MDDFIDFLKFFAVVLLVVGVLTAIALWGANAIQAKSCYERGEAYRLSVDYGMFKGCVVTTENGTLTDLDDYLTIREGR